MIEDDDSFIQKDGLDDYEEDRSGLRPWLICTIIFAIWLIWVAVCFFAFRDSVSQAIKDSGVLELIAGMEETEEAATTRTVNLVYPFYDGTTTKITLSAQRHGGDVYHDTVEALISEYPYEALLKGAVNLVDEKTNLNGLSVSSGVCYVDLSSQILQSGELSGYTAFDQIADTLLLFDSIEHVEFLIDGQLLDPAD